MIELCKRRWQSGFAKAVVSKYFHEKSPLILKCFVLDQHEIGKSSSFDSQSHHCLLCKGLCSLFDKSSVEKLYSTPLEKINNALMDVAKMDSMSIYPL